MSDHDDLLAEADANHNGQWFGGRCCETCCDPDDPDVRAPYPCLAARLAAALRASEAEREAFRDRPCGVCGHELRRHDPEDRCCDAPATEGFDVCPCGRDVTVFGFIMERHERQVSDEAYWGACKAEESAQARLAEVERERDRWEDQAQTNAQGYESVVRCWHEDQARIETLETRAEALQGALREIRPLQPDWITAKIDAALDQGDER